jgi:hypothetical protein
MMGEKDMYKEMLRTMRIQGHNAKQHMKMKASFFSLVFCIFFKIAAPLPQVLLLLHLSCPSIADWLTIRPRIAGGVLRSSQQQYWPSGAEDSRRPEQDQ